MSDETEQLYASQVSKTESTDVKAVFSELFSHKIIPPAIIMIITASFLDIQYFIQEDLNQQDLDLGTIGVFFGLGMFLVSFASSKSVTFSKMGKNKSYLIIVLIMGVSFILMSVSPILGILGGFYLVMLARGLLTPLLNTHLNKQLDSTNRATVLSIIGAITKISYIIFSILITYIINTYDFDRAYLVTGFLI